MTLTAFTILLVATLGAYALNLSAARQIRSGGATLHSLAGFHGMFAALVVALPVLLLIVLWLLFQETVLKGIVVGGLPADAVAGLDDNGLTMAMVEIGSLASGRAFGQPEAWKVEAGERLASLRVTSAWLMVIGAALLAAALAVFARSRVAATFRARQGVESIVLGLMIGCSLVAILTTVGIVLSLVFESIRFFSLVPLHEFLFGLQWEPQIAMRADQVAGQGAFGLIPVILGSIVIMVIALVIAVPVGLFSAIYLNEFASPAARRIIKPVLEILAGVPTVVYGFFAILVVAPALRSLGAELNIPVSPNTALAAGSVMAIMLIPFISSFADDALSAVPRSLRDGSFAMGATRGETMMKVLFPAAIPGIVGGILLAVSRAIGETMIVVMAAGIIAKLTINPLDTVTTVTVQIVTLLIGDTEFDNPKTLAAFALGMVLFVITLAINVVALRIVRRYRELYD